jgi:hypothetical protein
VKDWASLVHRLTHAVNGNFTIKCNFLLLMIRSTDDERLEKVAFAFRRPPLIPLGRRALLLEMRAEGCAKITSSLRDGEEFW